MKPIRLVGLTLAALFSGAVAHASPDRVRIFHAMSRACLESVLNDRLASDTLLQVGAATATVCDCFGRTVSSRWTEEDERTVREIGDVPRRFRGDWWKIVSACAGEAAR